MRQVHKNLLLRIFLFSLIIINSQLRTPNSQLIYAQDKLIVDGDLEINSPAADQRFGLIFRPQAEPAPASPSNRGQIYYNTTDNQLYYSNGASWQSLGGQDKNVATRIVAASNSLDTTRADEVCDGTDDQQEINRAINELPAGGGIVYLLEGTYNISAALLEGETFPGIRPHTNTAIIGTGRGTVLKVASGVNNLKVINASSVSGIFISRLMIDGGTGSSNEGIRFSSVANAQVDGVWIENFSGAGTGEGIFLENSNNNIVSRNHFSNIATCCIRLLSNSNNNNIFANNINTRGFGIMVFSPNNIVAGNNIQGSGKSLSNGIEVSDISSNNNIISGNNVQGAFGSGISTGIGRNNIFTANNVQSSALDAGIRLTMTSNNIVAANNIQSNQRQGIRLRSGSFNNTLLGNTIYDNGGTADYSGIEISEGSDNNFISANLFSDSEGASYPINIGVSDTVGNISENNYLSGNLISSWPVNYNRINDSGANTKYTDKVKMTLERAVVWTVNNGATIIPLSPTSYQPVIGNGAVTVNTIAVGKAAGDLLILEGTNNTNKVTIENGGNVRLSCDIPPCPPGLAGRDLGLDDVLTLVWNGTNWVELHWSNNTPP